MDRFWRYKLDHVIFWSATVVFHMFTRVGLLHNAGLEQFIIEIVVRNVLLAVIIYTNLLYLIPRIISKRRYFLYASGLVMLLVFYVFAKNAHDVYLYGFKLAEPGRQYFFYNSFYNLSIALFYLAFSIALELSRAWYMQREQLRKIEIEKLNTELAYLKSQINPHFLFNSINTIYFQIDKSNVEARETLSTFSEMLRYQLYECNGREVPIEKEVQYLKNYIDLQRLRKDENYQITFSSHPEVREFSIAPLLLICLVENAFKHVSHHNRKNRIDVALVREDGKFKARVFNTKENKPANVQDGAGIGLKNVRRRLELLYNGRHQLIIKEDEESFCVDLTIEYGGV